MQTEAPAISFRLLSHQDRGAIEHLFLRSRENRTHQNRSHKDTLSLAFKTSVEALNSKHSSLIGCFTDQLVAIFIFASRDYDHSVYEFTMFHLPFENAANVINDIFHIGVFFIARRNCRVLTVDRNLQNHESYRTFSKMPEIERDEHLLYYDVSAYVETFKP
jgi:hypothetical protein